jgi:long-chain acyl-CoA synthetase
VLVNVNPLYTAEEMAKQFEDAEPHALIIIDMFADKMPEATRGHPIPNIIVTRVAEFFPSMPRGIVGLVQKYWDRSVAPIELARISACPTPSRGPRAPRANHVEVSDFRASGAGRCGRAPVYRRHHRCLQGRDADPREPDREHGTDASK